MGKPYTIPDEILDVKGHEIARMSKRTSNYIYAYRVRNEMVGKMTYIWFR